MQQKTLHSLITAQTPIGVIGAVWFEDKMHAIFLADTASDLRRDIAVCFPNAGLEPLADKEVQRQLSGLVSGAKTKAGLPLVIVGTEFQRSVWTELRRIPRGSTVTYSQLTERLGLDSTSHRAVAGACADNMFAIAIPCHRVIRTDGGLGGYRWGIRRKQSLLELEGALNSMKM